MSRVRMAKLLQRCIPEMHGRPIEWRADHIYPCRGYWRMHRDKLDVMSWTATARYADGSRNPCWNGGCWETMTECLKAGEVHIYGMYGDTIAPGPYTEPKQYVED